ncbi:MAG: hypothetical protein IJ617_04705 [Oscillospiraceae bacterium]|nr:hypothetical protein [Oscillospiraceae bacterium]
MKRILALLLVLLLLPCPPLAAGAPEAVEIADAESFLYALGSNPAGFYRLTADIDLSSLNWTPLPFSGHLDGGGHCVYNLRVTQPGTQTRTAGDGNLKFYDTSFAGLFSVLENATVENLRLRGAYIGVDAETHCFAALLAGGIFGSTIRGCDLEGRVRLNNYAVMTGVGGIAGYGSGTIADNLVSVELVFEDRNFEARCEEFLGGALACGIAEITGNTVELDAYDSCHGYVHNGGLVGMYYHCGMEAPTATVSYNTVSGRIRFFEDNTDRRAYCFAVVGESLTYPAPSLENATEGFVSDEVFEYDKVLLPEGCETPSYVEEVTEPGCDSWGYTVHTCSVCGYSWTDSYTPPTHVPGAWERDGKLEVQRCVRCGQVLDTREPAAEEEPPAELPPEQAVSSPEDVSCRLEPAELRMDYNSAAQVEAIVSPPEMPLRWSSSDPAVVSVDASGVLHAVGRGHAVVTCAAGGQAEGRCSVTVTYSLPQWLIIVFLFGWIWY